VVRFSLHLSRGVLSYTVRSTVLIIVNYWRMKREDIDIDIPKPLSPVRTRKLLIMAVISIPLSVYCAWNQISAWLTYEWPTPTSLAENIASLQIVLVLTRSDLDTANGGTDSVGAFFHPLLTFYFFAWFGFEVEARRAYREAFLKLGRLIGVMLRVHRPRMSTLPFSWSATATLQAKFQRGLANTLSLVLPNAPQITPYTSTVPPDDSAEALASPIRIQPSNPAVGNTVDVKRQGRVPLREPPRRRSIHKPPLAALNPANAIPSVSDVPLRRLSHHKPRLVPLAPPNAPAVATPGASGSNPPRVAAVDNLRRQEGLASHPSVRRLSYHKPAFVPLAPANANSVALSAPGPTIPLAEIPMDIIGERNAVLHAENVVEDRVAPPPLSSVSSTAPPPFSTPSTATAAPPYRDVDPLLNHVP